MNSTGEQIDALRARWGSRLLVLAHHYQRGAVARHADHRGDSLELARRAAGSGAAERIAFCGVRFMAESADILTRADQAVYMPETRAGCPMADMADAAQVRAARERLARGGGDWLPVVYVNSSADVKAECGRWGGSACTSSNAARVVEWVLAQGRRAFFLPDEHLGRNTAHDLGLGAAEVALYDPGLPDGGLDDAALARARMVVWKGYCLVHTAFTAAQVREVRGRWPRAKIIVHPEAPREVVALADAHGSTSRIIEYVRSAPDGAIVVVGTELNLVQRLAEECAPRVTVRALSPSVCANMARTTEEALLRLLAEWPAACRIGVPPDVASDARRALERMLTL